MICEIQAKTLLAAVKQPDPVFGLRYNMNLYRGCQHQCIYCDSRSACYQIENFADVLVKVNAIDLLKKEIRSKRTKGAIGTGSMNDPYGPVERTYRLTGRALEVIAQHRFPVHVLTKSDLVTRDLAALQDIAADYAAVTFTLTTTDDDLARKLEPGAPAPGARLAAMRALSAAGIYCGVSMMPILPFIEDTADNIAAIVTQARDAGAQYIIPWFGMSMRDRQRAYFYARLDQLFPGLRRRYEAAYGERYICPVPGAERLSREFEALCEQAGMATRIRPYAEPESATQPALL